MMRCGWGAREEEEEEEEEEDSVVVLEEEEGVGLGNLHRKEGCGGQEAMVCMF